MKCKHEGNCIREVAMGDGCYFTGKAERWLGECLYLKSADQVKAEAVQKKAHEEKMKKAKAEADRWNLPMETNTPKTTEVGKTKLPSKKAKAVPKKEDAPSKKASPKKSKADKSGIHEI